MKKVEPIDVFFILFKHKIFCRNYAGRELVDIFFSPSVTAVFDTHFEVHSVNCSLRFSFLVFFYKYIYNNDRGTKLKEPFLKILFMYVKISQNRYNNEF